MKIWNHMKVAWMNARELPIFLCMFIRGGMISSIVLLGFVMLPLAPWTFDGRAETYAEMWQSGDAERAVIWLLLMATGCWGIAMRKSVCRWILILSPFAFLVIGPYVEAARLANMISAGFWALVMYGVLFHVASVRTYFSGALDS